MFYGVEKRLVGLASLERIAASEKIVSKEAVDGGGDFSLAGCVVALAGGLAVEDEAGSESDGERGDGEDDPRASCLGFRQVLFGKQGALLGEAGLVALDAAAVEVLQALDQYRGAIEAASGISASGIGDVLTQEWVVNASFPARREGLAEISDDELVEQNAEGVDIGGGGGSLSGKDFGGIGKYLVFALIGLLVVGLVRFFVAFSPGANLLYAFIGAAIFVGFTLYDFSNIKFRYGPDDYVLATVALYLDFLNLFWFLVQILLSLSGGGSSRRN